MIHSFKNNSWMQFLKMYTQGLKNFAATGLCDQQFMQLWLRFNLENRFKQSKIAAGLNKILPNYFWK